MAVNRMEKQTAGRQQNHEKKNRTVQLILTLLFAAVFVYGAINLFGNWQEYRESVVLYQNALDVFLTSVEDPVEVPVENKLAEAKLDFTVDLPACLR